MEYNHEAAILGLTNELEIGMPDARSALSDFRSFVMKWDTAGASPDENILLQDYMSAWLEIGDAVEATFGEYCPTYLLTLVAIIDEYERDPSILNYNHNGVVIERRVKRIVDLLDVDAGCWHRATYERRKLRLLMGDRR